MKPEKTPNLVRNFTHRPPPTPLLVEKTISEEKYLTKPNTYFQLASVLPMPCGALNGVGYPRVGLSTFSKNNKPTFAG